MTPLKLYLLRAVYDWSVEQGCTPHLIVDATAPGVHVPPGYVQDGQIVLNIHPRAVAQFELSERALSFSARFGGRPFEVAAPLPAIRAVYAKENGQGIAFPEAEEPQPPGPAQPADARRRPALKRVK